MSSATPAAASESKGPRASRPLCVDLDGTILATDLLWESCFAMLKRKPWQLFSAPGWLLRGRAYLKHRMAQEASLNPAALPYHQDVVQFLRKERESGREVVLVTASDEKLAGSVAEYLGIFSLVLASDGQVNLSGRRKLSAIQKHLGGRDFDYIGDSEVDLPVCEASAQVALVRPSARLLKRAQRVSSVQQTFGDSADRRLGILRALRVHQWAKNMLIWVPLLLAHKISDPQRFLWGLLAFFSFSLAASSVYVFNDLLDLESDRLHPRKRMRPFASGGAPLWAGAILVPLLIAGSFALAVPLPSRSFAGALGIYLLLGFGYCLVVKRVVILDVFLLAGLYTLRVLAGGLAVQVPVTPWLLAFSLFLFLSLALVKRYSELHSAPASQQAATRGRNYLEEDEELLRSMGAASGYVAVLVLALYVNSREVISLYRHPQWLWLVCALLLYWVTRIWFKAHRGEMDEDPLMYTLKDPGSYAVGAGVLLAILAAL